VGLPGRMVWAEWAVRAPTVRPGLVAQEMLDRVARVALRLQARAMPALRTRMAAAAQVVRALAQAKPADCRAAVAAVAKLRTPSTLRAGLERKARSASLLQPDHPRPHRARKPLTLVRHQQAYRYPPLGLPLSGQTPAPHRRLSQSRAAQHLRSKVMPRPQQRLFHPLLWRRRRRMATFRRRARRPQSTRAQRQLRRLTRARPVLLLAYLAQRLAIKLQTPVLPLQPPR